MKVINSHEENDRAEDTSVDRNRRASFIGDPVPNIFAISLLLAGIVFIASFSAKSVSTNSGNELCHTTIKPDALFADCRILRESCSSETDCSLSSFCGSRGYETCRIYDCGNTYGVYVQYEGCDTSTAKKDKYDKALVRARQDVCRGNMQVLEQKCVDEKMQVKVSFEPNGDCKIGDFVVVYDGMEIQPNTFVPLNINTYAIEAETCGKITTIAPRTEEGIAVF